MKLQNNTHYWVLTKEYNPQLMIVLYENKSFWACGPWEVNLNPTTLIIIGSIPIPKEYKGASLYYGDYI